MRCVLQAILRLSTREDSAALQAITEARHVPERSSVCIKEDYIRVILSGTHFAYASLTLFQSNTVQKCFSHSSLPQTPYPALIHARSCTLMQNRGNRVSPSVVKSNLALPPYDSPAFNVLGLEYNDAGVVEREKSASDDRLVWRARDDLPGFSGDDEWLKHFWTVLDWNKVSEAYAKWVPDKITRI